MRYLTKQLNDLRELETKLGSGHHNIDSMIEFLKQEEVRSVNDDANAKKNGKKYVAGAAVGSAGATALLQ